jgi:hypothetical protein
MLGYASAHIPMKATSDLERQQTSKALCHDCVLLFAITLSNICWKEIALNVDAIKEAIAGLK